MNAQEKQELVMNLARLRDRCWLLQQELAGLHNIIMNDKLVLGIYEEEQKTI